MELIVGIALIVGLFKAGEWGFEQAVRFAKAGAKRGRAAYAAKHPKTAAPVGRVGQFVGRTTAAGFHGAVAGGRGFGAGMRAGWPEGRQRAYDWQERRQQAKTQPVTEDEATVHPFPQRPAQDDRPAGTPVAVPSRRDRMPSWQTLGATALADDPDRAWNVDLHWPDGTVKEPFDLAHPKGLRVWDEDDLAQRTAGFDQLVEMGELSDYDVTEIDPAAERAELAAAADDDWQDDAMRGTPDDSTLQPGDEAVFSVLQNNGEWTTATTSDPDTYEDWKTAAFRQEAAGEIQNFAIDPRPAGQTEGLASVTSITGGNDMSVTTVNGTDIQTFEQLLAFLGNVEQESVADMDDATADMERAKADAAGIEAMLASLHQLELDDTSLGEIGALGEDSSARLAAAQARLAACESRAAHAKAARDGVRSRHGAMQEARDSTPNGGAKREFYQH